MKVIVNGETVELAEHTTVAGLLDAQGFPEKGIAVAVDWWCCRARSGSCR